MRYVTLGGLKLSAIGLGTWQFGAGEWGYGTSYANETAPKIVERALELGVNFFDTAEAYAFGKSEKILGAALGDRRDDVVIATKLFPVAPVAPVIASRVKGSLRRLGTDSIDLYQVHWKNPVFPVGPTMKALGEELEKGTIRHVGVSNFSKSTWEAAEAALGHPVLSNQVQYSLAERGPEAALLPYAQSHDRLVIAYSPLAQGLLSGRYTKDHIPQGMRASTPGFLKENLERIEPLLEVLARVGKSHDATSSQVALAWLIKRPNVVVIPGASSVAQLEANAQACDLDLSVEEDQELDEVSLAYRPTKGVAAVPKIAQEKVTRLLNRLSRAREGLGN